MNNNMMRKNNNRGGGNNKHRNNGGARRYNNNSGGNRSGANESQNLQRQKHHATQQLGKYSDMARNAQINGDRVDVEYYLQHVDHYTRVLTDIAAVEAERYAHQRESQIIPGGPNDPNAQQHAENHSGFETSGGGSAQNSQEGSGDNAASHAATSSEEPAQQSRPRHPRRQHYSEPLAQRDNGAKEANANRNDIPLPDSILPPIGEV